MQQTVQQKALTAMPLQIKPYAWITLTRQMLKLVVFCFQQGLTATRFL
jgi:hypothetical protein